MEFTIKHYGKRREGRGGGGVEEEEEKSVSVFFSGYIAFTAVAQWLRFCATNRKATGSIPDGVIGIFH